MTTIRGATGSTGATAATAAVCTTGAADPRADRYLRATRREPTDVTPVWFMRQAGRSLPEFRAIRASASLVEITRDPALCAEVTLQPVDRLGVDAAILFADITTPFTGLGVDFEIKPGVGPVVARPIASAADIGRLRTFEPEAAVGPLLEAIRLIRAASPVPLIGFAGAPFTLACYLIEGGPSRDFRRTRTFMHAEPAAWAALMARLVDATAAYLAAQVAAGAQAIQVFDSWVGGLGPLDYRTSVQPWMTRLWASIGMLGVPTTHFGVGTGGLLALQAEAGGDVIGLDWHVALDEGWAKVPDRAVQGNLDPYLLLGPWAGVEAAARWILDLAGGRPGHIFNLGHGVLPETDADTLVRLVELVHGYRPAAGGPRRGPR